MYSENAPHVDPAIYDLGLPIFGICYGMRLMAQQLDGKVERASKREYGKAEWSLLRTRRLSKGLSKTNGMDESW